ncbi:MAG: aminomethyl-transferring glycine dehydrogenase subunit GcvPA [Roseiarcus sp.]
MRYLPLDDADRRAMLEKIGVADIDALFAAIPPGKRLSGPLDLPSRASELSVERQLGALSAENVAAGSAPFFLGAGAYRHHVPATVDHLIQRSEFLTSYTPYQPEISQGTLQALFEFQTQVAELTGMEVANSSMYDGSTACGEAMLMAHRVTRRGKALVSGGLHPQYADVAATLAKLAGEEIVRLPPDPRAEENLIAAIDDKTSCAIVQSPDFFGHPRDLKPIADVAHAKGALLIAVFTEVLSLAALRPPGAMGADIVVGEGQSLGNALTFGGPYVGLFATRMKHVRQMPGRLAGETVDAEGRRGFVLTLSTREQHIRREKATSNICTNSGLCALAFSIHLTLLGGAGLRRLANVNHANAVDLTQKLGAVPGIDVLNAHFFNEFTIRTPRPAAELVEALAANGIIAGLPVSRLLPGAGLDDLIVVASTEINTGGDRAAFAAALRDAL